MSHFLDVGPRIKNESDAETPDKRTSSSPASSAMSEAVTPSIMVMQREILCLIVVRMT